MRGSECWSGENSLRKQVLCPRCRGVVRTLVTLVTKPLPMASSVMQMGTPLQFFRSLWASRDKTALLDVLDVLPVRLLFPVFTYLDPKSLGRSTQASMAFATAAEADELWRRVYLNYTGRYAENRGLCTEWKAILKDFVTRQVVLHYDPSVEPERHDPGLVMSSNDVSRQQHKISRPTTDH